ncbi:MAG: hypothetical protein IJ785_06630 [Bacteroidales bacterium]|nr:hypothetical protein [Bacteroidales bacterium]
MKRIEAIPEVKRHQHIVLCGDNINALSILRSLGEVGLRPTAILLDEGHIPLVSKCRYLGRLIQTKSFDESLQQLLAFADPQCPPFVYTSDDNHQSLIDLHYEELKRGFYFFNAGEAGRVTHFMDKNNICLAAKECGFAIAESEVLTPGQLPRHIHYPVITKTLNPYEDGWKRDVGIYHDPESLAKAYTQMVSKTLLVQEYIVKKNELSMQGFSIDAGRIVYLPFKRQYFRFTDSAYGSYCYYKTYQDDDLYNKIVALLRMIRFSGNFEIEFLEKPDGSLVFLEINFRHALSNYASTIGGVNLPYEWAKATLLHTVDGLHPTKDYFTAINEFKDFNTFVKSGKIGLLPWLKDLVTADSYYLWNKHDPKPLFSFYLGKLTHKHRK